MAALALQLRGGHLRLEALAQCPVACVALQRHRVDRIANGPDVLTRVSMVGNDLKLDDGVGTCGKEGQSVPVGVGQPTLRIDAMTVGGTN